MTKFELLTKGAKKMHHILKAQQFSRQWIDNFFKEVEFGRLMGWYQQSFENKKMISFFYEPSTRTRCSFEMAMKRLGGDVVFSTENAREFSSVAKGETIEDTIRVLCGYQPDVIVLRSDREGMAERAAEFSSAPIINAGDGAGEHPTQALLDIYTIQKELGKIDGLAIAMVGDLARSRTVRSLCYLLPEFSDVKIYFVSPENLKIKEDIKKHLEEREVWFRQEDSLKKVASKVDVIYQTRIQTNRDDDLDALIKQKYERAFIMNKNILDLIKKNAIIMHPLPRNEEISPEVDGDPRAAYFRQSANGLFVRMALLRMILLQ